MQGFGKELEMYAGSGLRQATDWRALGREVCPGSTPRCTLELRGTVLEMFSRDQTQRPTQVQASE